MKYLFILSIIFSLSTFWKLHARHSELVHTMINIYEQSDSKTETLATPEEPLPIVVSFSQVYFASGLTVYLKLQNLSCFNCAMRLMQTEGASLSNLYPNSEGELILENLLHNSDYKLFYTGIDGQEVVLFNFSSLRKADGVVYASQALLDSISSWMKNPLDLSILDYLENLQGFHRLEKLAYLQKSFGSAGHAYKEDLKTSEHMPHKEDFPEINNCNCIFNLWFVPVGSGVGISNVEPATLTNGQVLPPQNDDPKYWSDFYSRQKGKKRDTKWFDQVHQGPSRRERTELDGKEGYLEWTWNSGADIHNDFFFNRPKAFYAQLFIAWYCYDVRFRPSECGCERKLSVGYAYESNLLAAAHTKRGRKNSKALAQVEDAMFLFGQYLRSDTLILHKAYQNQVNATQNMSYTPTALIDLTDLLLNERLSRAHLYNKVISSFLRKIEKGLVNPSFDYTIEQKRTSRVFSVEGTWLVDLPVNQPFVVTLSSTASHKHSGEHEFNTQTELASNFYLTLRHDGNSADPYCCAPNYAEWILSTQEQKAPSSYQVLRNRVEAQLGDHSGWYHKPVVGRDYGNIIGKMPDGCLTGMGLNVEPNHKVKNEMDILEIKDGAIFYKPSLLDHHNELEGYEFIVSNALGQKIITGRTDENGKLADLIKLPDHELVIVTLYLENNALTKKILLAKP